MLDKRICIAKIISCHGLKGEVKIKSYTDNPADIFKFKTITDLEGNCFVLSKKALTKDKIIASIQNFSSRTDSENLVGKDLYISRNELPEINNDEFYYTDLIGLEVLDIDKSKVGLIKAIHNFGSNDIIEIDFIDKINNNLFAFTKEQFPEINIKSKYIIFNRVEEIKT